MMTTNKTLITAVVCFSSCFLASPTQAIADTSIFPQEQAREIPVTGYFLNEAQRRCNTGNESFCHRINHLTDQEKQRIREQENARHIPYFSLCQLNQSQLLPLQSQPQIPQIPEIPCLPR
ncbi:hypothetical protein H6G41_09700 [Tolypothrix sp. FACHB-123]|uniref:hypothetical protein n=1 Tax=Tolypothrix sp. FACHB-123 TaxID=2692868 RepID=UPI00168680F5|nr:hypothetical protein [Tolypothrix sp. FACHB-123]MBD2354893.1 hypothetical protein [Tolypothrix sp. FACHB-123]